VSNAAQKTLSGKGPLAYENWQAAEAGVPRWCAYEYPLFTDADIIGDDLDDGCGPYQLLNAVPDTRRKRFRPTLVLHVEHHVKYDPEVRLETDDESYHGGLLQDEIAALVSLSLGIRLKAGDPIRMFGAEDPTGRPVSWGHIDDPVPPDIPQSPILPRATGEHRLEEAFTLRTFPRLQPKYAAALVRAARLYQEAVWIAESTPELSWIMLTSAVETAASCWRSSSEAPLDRLRASRPQLEEMLKEYGGDELVLKVAEEMAPYMGATRKFVDFILEFLPEPPAERSYEWAQHSWDPKSMRNSMRLIYQHRSRALHGGTPFPAPMCMPPRRVAQNPALTEVPTGLSSSTRGSTWARKDTPMLLHTFEYLVRNALLRWWSSTVTNRTA
jgi:hypothetical protein